MSHFNPDDRKKYLKFLYAWPCPRKFSEGLQSCRPYRDKIYVKQAIGSKGKTKNTVLKQERTWHTKGTAEIGFSLPRRQFEKEIELKCSCFEASDYWLKVWWCRLQQMRNSISDSTGNTTSPPRCPWLTLVKIKALGESEPWHARAVGSFNHSWVWCLFTTEPLSDKSSKWVLCRHWMWLDEKQPLTFYNTNFGYTSLKICLFYVTANI